MYSLNTIAAILIDIPKSRIWSMNNTHKHFSLEMQFLIKRIIKMSVPHVIILERRHVLVYVGFVSRGRKTSPTGLLLSSTLVCSNKRWAITQHFFIPFVSFISEVLEPKNASCIYSSWYFVYTFVSNTPFLYSDSLFLLKQGQIFILSL